MREQLRAMYSDDRLVTPELVDCYVGSAQAARWQARRRALLSGRLNVDVRAAVRRLRLPTLLLWGDLARQNPVAHAHAFRVLKHDLEWTLVHEAGDLPHDERSNEVNAALRSFLERTRRWTGSPEPTPRNGLTLLRPDRDTDSHRSAAFVIFRPLCRIRR